MLYIDKVKTELLITTAPIIIHPFLEYYHFKIQSAQLPPEQHEYFTLSKLGLSFEFLDGSDYDTVITHMVM